MAATSPALLVQFLMMLMCCTNLRGCGAVVVAFKAASALL